jgi:hypothetical protein
MNNIGCEGWTSLTKTTNGYPTCVFVLGCHSSNGVFLFLGDDWWHGKTFWTLRMCKGLRIAEVNGPNTLRRATHAAMALDGNDVWQPCQCEVAWIGTGTLRRWLDVASGVDCRGVCGYRGFVLNRRVRNWKWTTNARQQLPLYSLHLTIQRWLSPFKLTPLPCHPTCF